MLILAMNINAEAQLAPRKPTPAPAPASLTISDTKVSLAEGATKTLTVSGLASGERARWASSNSSIATVDANGKVTAVKAGTATITASTTSAKATCEVTVTAKPAAEPLMFWSVKSNAQLEKITQEEGTSALITTLGVPEGEIPKFSSSNNDVVTVNNSTPTGTNCSAKFNKPGTATITVTAGTKKATCQVTVTATSAGALALSETNISMVEGATKTLTVTGLTSGQTATWASSTAAVATVTAGKVTAKTAGKTTITATVGTRKATCEVTVTAGKLTISETLLSLAVGATQKLTVTGQGTDETVTWKTDNSAVATVSAGTITAVKAGTAKITATAGSKTATCNVTVTSSKLTLSKTSMKITVGEDPEKLTVTAGLSTGEKVTWKSSSTNVATVDSEGNVSGKAVGSTTIVATTANGKEGKCDIQVYIMQERTHLGQGINIFSAETFSSKFIAVNNPVVNISRFAREKPSSFTQNEKITNDLEYDIVTGKSVVDIVTKVNTKNHIGYKGAFTASLDANYSKGSSSSRTTSYVKVKGQVIMMKEYITSPTIATLQPYLTKAFKDAVNGVNSKDDAEQVMKTYGTHIITRCNWGGVVDMDINYSSLTIVDSSTLSVTVAASAFGVDASSSTTNSKFMKNFKENNTAKIKARGGNEYSPTTVEKFNEGYDKWIKSIKDQEYPWVACGVDSEKDLLPIIDIVNVIAPAKKTYFTSAYSAMESASLKRLNGYTLGRTQVVTAIGMIQNVGDWGDKQTIPDEYNHVVLNDRFDFNNSTDLYNDDSDMWKRLLYLNRYEDTGNSTKTKDWSLHLAYKTMPLEKCDGVAISEIKVFLSHDPPSTQSWWKKEYGDKGWTDPKMNLNLNCDGDKLGIWGGKKNVWLAYKKTTAADAMVITFIGSRNYKNGSVQYKNTTEDLSAAPQIFASSWLTVTFGHEYTVHENGWGSVKNGQLGELDCLCGNAWDTHLIVLRKLKSEIEKENKR